MGASLSQFSNWQPALVQRRQLDLTATFCDLSAAYRNFLGFTPIGWDAAKRGAQSSRVGNPRGLRGSRWLFWRGLPAARRAYIGE